MAYTQQQSMIKPDYKPEKLPYSCEEIYERMDKGLCIFCEELDTPGHHDLKHKGVRIFMVECDDYLASDDIEEFHQTQETVTNLEPFKETTKNLDSFIEPLEHDLVSQVVGSVSDVLLVHKMDSYVKKVEESSQQSTNGNDKIVAHQLFDQMPNEYQKGLTVIESSNKEVLSFSHKDARVWEPGGVLIEHDRWKELEKCYNRGRLMRLMHWMSSMWWKETKSREFNRLSVACSSVDIKTWHCVKHETQQTDFHVWYRWKNKAEKLSANYALLELMVLGLVSFQPNKGTGVVGLVPKAIVLREFSHCRSNDCGTIRLKLFLVRDTSSDGCKEDSWSCIWLILKELCSAGFEKKKETIKKNFNELSKLEKDHELLSPEKLEVHILYLFRKGGFIEFSGCHTHLKKLRAALERFSQQVIDELAKRIVIDQKSDGGLKCGDVKFHLKHKWRSKLLHAPSGLEVFVEDVVLFTSPDKLFFTKNHKLLHPETGFCTHYNGLEQLSTEFQGSLGLNYFTYLIFKWNQALNCGCEAGHISSGFFYVGDVHGFFTCSKLQIGDETQEKRLLFLNNNNKVDHTVKANWFHNEPIIRGVFHLQRPPELIDLQGNPNFITKVLFQWKEHPPNKFFSGFYGQVLMLSSLRTRMF